MDDVAVAEMTVADLAAHGANSDRATCAAGGRDWRAMVRFLPPRTTLALAARLPECRACGGQRISVEPIWRRGQRLVFFCAFRSELLTPGQQG